MTRARDVANLIGSGNYSSTTFTATAGQTVFSIAHTQNFVQVFMNGLLLDLTVDYTSNGSAVTLTSGAAAGDEIEVVAYNTFSVGDALNQAAADTRYVNATGDTITGNLGVNVSPTAALDVRRSDASGKIAEFHQSTGYGFELSSSASLATLSSGYNQDWAFTTNAGSGSVERMRIDSSGNVLVGKTASDGGVAGHEMRPTSFAAHTISGGTALVARRLTNDGTVILIQYSGGDAGYIGTSNSGDLYIGNSGTGVLFAGGSNGILPINPSNTVLRDNAIDLGSGSYRFDDIFATNGSIQTSDENEKQNIASLTSAEITAATAISKLFKTFKWKDKVSAKGDDARTHTGVIAQQVQTAMSDAGLDASKYAFWCSNTWWEKDVEVAAVEADEEKLIKAQDAFTRTDIYDTLEEAPEGATERTRMGVRYPELLAFIGAATEQRLTNIETRLAALEGG